MTADVSTEIAPEAQVQGINDGEEDVQAPWTERQIAIARHAVRKWQALNHFKLGEAIMARGAQVKEANIIAWVGMGLTVGKTADKDSRMLGHDVSYNFVIVDVSMSAARSTLDDLSGAIDIEAGSGSVLSGEKHDLAIRVMDRESSGKCASSV